jgi:histidyl-tRNA synthetase
MISPLILNQNSLRIINKVMLKIRGFGIPVVLDVSEKGLKRALSYASSQGFTHMIIIGEKELSQNSITINNLLTVNQTTIPIDQLNLILTL